MAPKRSWLILALTFMVAADAWALPPPRPQPRDFVIFFTEGQCALTEQADFVLGEAAREAHAISAEKITILGYTDAVRPSESDGKLAACRADTAKKRLIEKGVLDRLISSGAASEPFGPSDAGAPTPLNRRVKVHVGYERE